MILSIDQGTTGTTVTVIDAKGKVLAKVNEEFEQLYPKPGWVEHNPEAIWRSVLSCIKRSLKQLEEGGRRPEIAAIGITNQRETVVMWERESGRAIANAIVWQCRRTADFCDRLKKKKLGPMIAKRTGLVIDPYFSASKIRWLLENIPGAKKRAQAGELAAGTVDTFLLWRLSGGLCHKTDVSNASRTQLMNIHKGNWDDELLKLFSVPRELLPEISPSSGVFAVTKDVPGLPDGLPIAGVAGDQQAALFGQTCFRPGSAKCTFGTGSFILLNTGTKAALSKKGILTTVAWQLGQAGKLTYALEGGAFICGAAVQWLRDELGFIKESREVEELALQVADSAGVEFVPALAGLGAPYWDPHARGLITGLTRGSNRAHIARATLEAMALQNVDILTAMQAEAKTRLRSLRVDGGAVSNNLLMQLQADYLGVEIERPQMVETTALGAAYLAGLGVGFWSDLKELEKIWQVESRFKVGMKPAQRKKRLGLWHEAVARTLFPNRPRF